MRITLTGATGFIGLRLVNRLLAERHELTILSRAPRPGTRPRYVAWEPSKQDFPIAALDGADAIIHLAGEPVSQRWTAEAKARIRSSRIVGTRKIVDAIGKLSTPPKTMLSASAIGYYGSRSDEILTESSPPGRGFLEETTVLWEKEAMRAEEFGVRVVPVRIGVVLGVNGGAMRTMIPVFRLGVGGTIGFGKQWMSWIQLDDLVSLFLFALENENIRGPMNGTAPKPVHNTEFTKTLASMMHRPSLFPVPKFVLRAFYGEMSQILFASQRVIPEVAMRNGFQFRSPELRQAFDKVLTQT
jgi:uncharacterized protein